MTAMEKWISAVLQAVDPYLIRLFFLTADPVVARDTMSVIDLLRLVGTAGHHGFPVLDDDDLESMISARRKTRKEKSAGFCPKCGKPVQVSDRFCPSCGKAIN